jgi:hypothetical protein
MKNLTFRAFVTIFFLTACGEQPNERRRVVPEGEPCPDATELARSARVDSATLISDESIELTPLCYYPVAMKGSNRGYCEREAALMSMILPSVERLRELSQKNYKPTDSGDKPLGLGEVACTTDGPILVLQADGPRCELQVKSETWVTPYSSRVWGWQSGMTPKDLIVAEHRDAYHLCTYHVVVED